MPQIFLKFVTGLVNGGETMQRERIEEVIINVFNDYLKEQDIEGEVTSDTILFGSESLVDSMGLVNVVMDIESYFRGQGHNITLAYEEAMTGEGSPFRTVTTMTDFILKLIEEASK
jgi:acyl carrier protein